MESRRAWWIHLKTIAVSFILPKTTTTLQSQPLSQLKNWNARQQRPAKDVAGNNVQGLLSGEGLLSCALNGARKSGVRMFPRSQMSMSFRIFSYKASLSVYIQPSLCNTLTMRSDGVPVLGMNLRPSLCGFVEPEQSSSKDGFTARRPTAPPSTRDLVGLLSEHLQASSWTHQGSSAVNTSRPLLSVAVCLGFSCSRDSNPYLLIFRHTLENIIQESRQQLLQTIEASHMGSGRRTRPLVLSPLLCIR